MDKNWKQVLDNKQWEIWMCEEMIEIFNKKTGAWSIYYRKPSH